VKNDRDEQGKYISLNKMLILFRDTLNGPRGAVFTDGVASFAIGCACERFWLFDSHGHACLHSGSFEDIQTQVHAMLSSVNIVDCTTFQSKPI